MKVFLDTADLEKIIQAHQTGLIDGITTNPTHLFKAHKAIKNGSLRDLVLEICKTMEPNPVSVEITEKEPKRVYRQALEISQLAPNVVVKVPCAIKYVSIIKRLLSNGVRLNITLVFSLSQALAMAKLGVQYISPFIGRIDDTGASGADLIYQIQEMISQYNFSSQTIAASIRGITHVQEAIMAGTDVITLPPPIFDKLLDHPLTDKGMKDFLDDWAKTGVKQFP